VLLFALAVSLLTGILFGLAPALRKQTFRAGARSTPGGSRRLHSGFVVSQIAMAVVLLVAAGTFGRTLLRLSSLIRVALAPRALSNPAQSRAAWRDVLDHARAVPGKVMGISLRKGRFFTDRDRMGNELTVVIDEVRRTTLSDKRIPQAGARLCRRSATPR
jgi:hypothetical protein